MTSSTLGVVRLALTLTDPAAPVAVMHFLTIRRDTPDGQDYTVQVTDASVREECEKAGLSVASWRKMLPSEAAPDREFRGAVKDVAGALEHDLDKVREIALTELRLTRNLQLAELDKEYMKALGQKNETYAAEVEARRQLLRDLPETVASELAAVTDVAGVKTVLSNATGG